MESVLELYKSLTIEHRMTEELILRKAIEEGVPVVGIRYGIFKDIYRGVIKSVDGDLSYFHYRPDNDTIRIIPPTDATQKWEASKLYKSCELGCDLSDEDDDDKEVEKGPEGGGGATGTANPMSVSEQTNINNQDDLLTEQHPGGVGALTPDRPEVGRQWHEETPVEAVGKSAWTAQGLLDGLNDAVNKSVPRGWRVVPQTERVFMKQELGRTDEEINHGQAHMTPIQKVQYQRWLNKSMSGGLRNLSDWLDKKRG